MSWYRQQLEDWLGELNVKADTVLDIGGAQGSVKDRVKSWEVKDYHVMDLPNWDLNEVWYDPPEADIVFCLEVFEYLIEPQIALGNIANCTKSKAYVTFPFVYPHHNELERDSLRYTESAIKSLGVYTGFKGQEITYRRDKSGLLKQFYAADGMRSAKEYPNHDVTGFIVEFIKG